MASRSFSSSCASMADRTYKPAGPIVAAFHDSTADIRFLMGPVGSSKSSASICELIKRGFEQQPGPDGKRHSRFGIIRNTFPELQSTTLKTVQHWLPFGKLTMSAPFTQRLQTGEVDIELVFLAVDRPDDIGKLLSLELTGAWLNEVRELPKAVLDMCGGRVGRFPPMVDRGPTWSGIICDTNMPDADHWIYRLAEEERPDGFAFFKQPGGVLWDGRKWVDNPNAENVANLPPNYYQRQLAGKAEAWIRVYLAAEYAYVGDDRPVFPEFVDSAHVAREPFAAITGLPLRIGVDFGLTPAAVIAQRTASGQWRCIDELCMDDMGIVRFAEALTRLLDDRFPGFPNNQIVGVGDPAGMARSQVDERSALAVLKEHTGIDFRPAPTNAFSLRREAVAGTMNRMIDGQPGLLVSPSCKMLRKALAGAYCFRRIQVGGDERYNDRPDKGPYSHIADALQYAVVGGGEARVVMNRERRMDRGRYPRPQAVSDYNPLAH